MDSMQKAIKEMMEKYNENRARWIAEFETDEGFHEWYTEQIMRLTRLSK